MVNVKPPARPVDKLGLWPPKNSKEYAVLDTDDWWKVAKKHNIDVWDLIDFNFKTRVPEEVNWYLRDLVGCKVPSPTGRNFTFRNASKGKIYVPLVPAPVPAQPPPAKKDFDQLLQDLWIEVVNSKDPRANRLTCMLSTLQHGADDRVIQWNHIAPGPPVPLGMVRPRDFTMGRSVVDPVWLFENIKTVADIDKQPPGTLGFGKIVTSLHKFIEELQPNLAMLVNLHDQVVETHQTLEKWANVQQGGSASMPREYRVIKDWESRQANDPKSVLNCLMVTGISRP